MPQMSNTPDLPEQVLSVPDVQQRLQAGDIEFLHTYFQTVQQAHESEQINGTQAAQRYRALAMQRVDVLPSLQQWVSTYPDDFAAQLAMGEYHLLVGWRARGTAMRRMTTELRFAIMNQYFEKGVPYLMRALELSTKPWAAISVGVTMEHGGSVAMPRSFIDLARAHMSESQELCEIIMWTLQPKWGGSEEEMHELHQLSQGFNWTSQEHADMHAYHERMQADTLRCQGEYGPALERLERLPLAHRSSGVWIDLGNTHRCRDEMAAASRCFEQAVQLWPTADAWESLAGALETSHDALAARRAYERAAELGSGWSAQRLASLDRERLHDPKVAVAAAYWLALAQQQFSADAYFEEASVNLLGLGRPVNAARALQLWKEAARWGSVAGIENCMLSFWDGEHTAPRDYKIARQYAQQAAEMGSTLGQGCYGRMLYQGHGGPKDYPTALDNLNAAAQSGDPRVVACLVRAHWFGQGTAVDRGLARNWLAQLQQLDAEVAREVRGDIFGALGWLRSAFAQALHGR